jgi:V-type H+-transporting ATPase subunit G
MANTNPRKSLIEPRRSLTASVPVNALIGSSRVATVVDSSRLVSMRSTGGSNSTVAGVRATSTSHASIQMEPGLQSLLIAESRAAEMIATARTKRNELMQQSHRESQGEIEVFRQQREIQYQSKLSEATQLEQYQATLDVNRQHQLSQLNKHSTNERTSLVNYIVHCVIDQIRVGAHPNTERVMF